MDPAVLLVLIGTAAAIYYSNPAIKANVDGMLAAGGTFTAASAIAQVTALYKDAYAKNRKAMPDPKIQPTWEQLQFTATAIDQIASKAGLKKAGSDQINYIPASNIMDGAQQAEGPQELPDSITFPVWRIQTQITMSDSGAPIGNMRQVICVSKTHQMFATDEPEIVRI